MISSRRDYWTTTFLWPTQYLPCYAREERLGEEALNCFEQMQHEGYSPDEVTFSCILKACGSIGALDAGKKIHAETARQGLLAHNAVLSTAIMDMYAKCGALDKAQEVLENLPVRDEVAWCALIAAYAREEGHGKEALNCFEIMLHDGHTPDAVTFMCILKACGGIQALHKGEQVHAEIARQGLLTKNVMLGNALVDMYVKCGALSKAQEVVDGLPVRDAVTWNTLMSGYVREEGHSKAVLNCLERMQLEGHSPDAATFPCILKACASIQALDIGEEIHSEVTRRCLLRENIMLGSALVDMYVKCGALFKAQEVLEGLPVRSLVIWSMLILGYAREEGHGEEALYCYECMQREGHSPDAFTFSCVLKACSSIRALDRGKQIHADVAKKGLLQDNAVLGAALVDMYVACSAFSKAQEVIKDLTVRDVVTWSVLIAGLVQEEMHSEEAFECFEQMQHEGHLADSFTFVWILKACGNKGVLDKGKQNHAKIIQQQLLCEGAVLGSALVDMYVKCGVLSIAQRVLKSLPVRNVVTWSSLIAGYAQHGHSQETLNCFEWMQCDGFAPDAVTYASVLNACSHAGLVDQGEIHYVKMSSSFGIRPSLVHQICMVDLFSRAGSFHKALQVMKCIPSESCIVWASLLAACRNWGNMKLAKWAFDHGIHLDEQSAVSFVCMSNICAADEDSLQSGE